MFSSFFFDRQCSPAGVLLTTLVAICYKIALLFEGYVRLSVDKSNSELVV